jgi:hypothetical protein
MGRLPHFVFRFVAGLALLASAGCKQKGPLHLHDSEAREFEANCGGAACTLKQSSGAKADGKPEAVLRMPGRLIGVCDVVPGAEPQSPADCRPLTCAEDDSCPPPQGLARGQCVNGLCTEPSHPIGVADAVMLCLAGTGIGHDSAKQAERYAMALNCGEPCRIPSPCRQP